MSGPGTDDPREQTAVETASERTEAAIDDLGARAATASRSNLITYPILAALAFGAGIAVARTLPPTQFAIYALALALRGTVQLLGDLGTGAASSRAFAQLEADGGRQAAWRIYGRLMMLRVGAAGLFVAAVAVFPTRVANIFGLSASEHDLLPLFAVLGAAEIVSGLAAYVLTGTLGQRWINRVFICQSAVQPALVVAAAAGGLGLEGVVAALAISSVGKATLLHAGAVRALRRIPEHWRHHPDLARSFTRTAAAAGLGKLESWVHSRPALSLVLISTAPRAEFAVFALAYDLTLQVLAFASAPATGVVPALMAKTIGDRNRVRRIARFAVRGLGLASVAIAVGLVIAMPVLDGLVYGEQYQGMGTYVALLAPVVVLDIVIAVPATAMLLADDETLGAYSRVRLLALGLAVLYPIVGFGNLIAVTAVMAAARGLTAVALLIVCERRVGQIVERRWWLSLAAAAAAAVAGGVLSGVILGNAVVRLILAPLIAVLIFSCLVRATGLLRESEAHLGERLIPAARPVFAWLAGTKRGGKSAPTVQREE